MEVGLVMVGPDPDGPPLTAGVVTRQDPEAGQRAGHGSAVTVWVRRSSLRMPALEGLTIAEARRVGREGDLTVLVVADHPDWPTDAGVVVRQHPAPGVAVDPGSWVNVWSGPGPGPGGSARDREPRRPLPPSREMTAD